MFQIRKNNMFFMCVTVGLVLLASKYRNNVLRSVKQLCHGITKKSTDNNSKKNRQDDNGKKKVLNISLDKVILADSPEKCDYAVQRIRCNLSDGVLGFDCEWVNEEPVSLLQLATHNGVCALFRLSKIGHIPPKLKELLSSRDFLKVGVASFDDGRKIAKDYNCQVVGTVDLRMLAHRHSLPSPKSLAALCVQYLDTEMDKILELRCSNWNADSLTNEQISYAAHDAYAAVLIYHQILQKIVLKRSIWESLVFYIKRLQSESKSQRFFNLPNDIIDARFKGSKDKCVNNIGQIIKKVSNGDYKSSVPTRNKPLYHNCYLQAPDGDILCTCDKKKAQWYVSKQLGEVVQEDPFTVKLKFEPSGRALGEVGKYYTQVKVNQCVVCGNSDKFIRKNVVPREYRKYFPLVMKSHQSHDILLLCPACHEISNCHDLQLRRKLADSCDAPLSGPLSHTRDEVARDWRMLQSTVKILKNGTAIPHKRKKELEMYVTKFTGNREITPSLLNVLHEQLSMKSPQKHKLFQDDMKKNTSTPQTKCQPHGQKVVQYFENREGGLVELERLWREHFLSTMKPKYLPELWSVCHNQERLSIRQVQSRIEPSDAKVAGINNE
ncbi:hypothetical protein TSAR_000057 [Trichomalopsis sarcophagae]|uniref:3'-5' exonuclease domain-containing protein n=1 Tax=Trichomalopsis sarcophagae TaxID=543379 RepID=A0A232F2M0_9HYME|nr:hypothetical protein TSAR_000057 [Trichomalopsis sarcophagae]